MILFRKISEKFELKNRDDFKSIAAQFFKFGLVGLSNTAVSLAVYYLFLWIDPKLYMVGSILGTILSIANAFFGNNRFVFKGNAKDFRSIMTRLGKTYISYGGTSLLSNVLLWLEVNYLHIDKTIAPEINLIITIPLNFVINKLWTFANNQMKS